MEETTSKSPTIKQYFLHVHNYQLRYPRIPGVRVIKKNRNNDNTDRVDIIPFELLEVIEGQFYRRKLDPEVHQEIHNASRLVPADRKQKVKEYLEVADIFIIAIHAPDFVKFTSTCLGI